MFAIIFIGEMRKLQLKLLTQLTEYNRLNNLVSCERNFAMVMSYAEVRNYDTDQNRL